MSAELQILYKDDVLVAVNKPAGHLVHPADRPQDGDLVTMKILRDQLGMPVYPIHRLDRPTSGVLLFGLEKAATTLLTETLAAHQWKKVYLAVIRGIPEGIHWDCKEPLRKKDGAPLKEAHTSFSLIETRRHPALDGEYLHLIRATPHTGRYHQIRRHLLHGGTPIVGDYRYAGRETSDRLCTALDIDTRMLLTARHLTLPHPLRKSPITITAPLDPAIEKCFKDPSDF